MFLILVILKEPEGLGRHQRQHRQVEPAHDSDADIRVIPCCRHILHGCEQRQSRNDDNADEICVFLRLVGNRIHNILDVRIRIDCKRQQRCEREEEDCNGDERCSESRNQGINRSLNITGACFYAGKIFDDEVLSIQRQNVVASGGQNHQRGCGADHQRINVNGERLCQALLSRMRNLSRSSSVRTGAPARFVGVDSSLNAHHDALSEDSSEQSFLIERGTENQSKHRSDLFRVRNQNDDCEYDVYNRHDWHDI